MSTRIATRFRALKEQARKGLIPYIAAGDPSPALTVAVMQALVRGGADLIELGVPFSDPMADGPVIQRAAERAIKNGVGLQQVLAMVAEFRQHDDTTPVVLMGYANPIEAMGQSRFALLAAKAGVDGVLVVDYPPEETRTLVALLKSHGIDSIFLVAPTTSLERLDLIAAVASGYVYYVSLTGVTGAAHLDADDVAAHLPALRQRFALPIGVGFGIRDAAGASAMGAIADAVVIGSKMVLEMESRPQGELIAAMQDLTRSFRDALDQKPQMETI